MTETKLLGHYMLGGHLGGGVKGSISSLGKGKKHWNCPSEVCILYGILDFSGWQYVCLYFPRCNGLLLIIKILKYSELLFPAPDVLTETSASLELLVLKCVICVQHGLFSSEDQFHSKSKPHLLSIVPYIAVN